MPSALHIDPELSVAIHHVIANADGACVAGITRRTSLYHPEPLISSTKVVGRGVATKHYNHILCNTKYMGEQEGKGHRDIGGEG